MDPCARRSPARLARDQAPTDRANGAPADAGGDCARAVPGDRPARRGRWAAAVDPGLALRLHPDPIRLNANKQTLLARLAEGVGVLADVLLRHLVDMRVGPLVLH